MFFFLKVNVNPIYRGKSSLRRAKQTKFVVKMLAVHMMASLIMAKLCQYALLLKL